MQPSPYILTVSQLNRQVKSFLENDLGEICVEGEISNLSKPASGHFYFSLKDASAQLRCVYFKNRHLNTITKKMCDGLQIIIRGRLSLYEARGEYQLIVDEVTEAGLGILYQQFNALKNKLAAEGLFAPERKKALPVYPHTIGIITSPTGAAIQDMLSTLARRYVLAEIVIYPCEVQGKNAALQLTQALIRANREQRCEVLILARGGGSIEDLWPFNDEGLARQIAQSLIPVVAGIGHETDFTIADFVADYRAETPTAAAARVTPNGQDLLKFIQQLLIRLTDSMYRLLRHHQSRLGHLQEKISSPQSTIASHWQTLDYLERQLQRITQQHLQNKKHQLQVLIHQLNAHNTKAHITKSLAKIAQLRAQLVHLMKQQFHRHHSTLRAQFATLNAVSPLATLDRGYAIVTQQEKVIFSWSEVLPASQVTIRLAEGRLQCTVDKAYPAPEPNTPE
ncbi:MAG: exodeoxyribonuclease VII large subunit [Legionella sp. 40-6]|nr:exodeoxyribonuclease VII large subunit [Legionella sp.]OJY16271.1 MAG: exodeoxyribonuclease VII large subunit [Legionella sp. 40-6]